MLASAAAEDEGLPEKEQGKKLEKWLTKPRIVFARTSPA
jgi:sodium/potassium-transporting ATPase subunit alpha